MKTFIRWGKFNLVGALGMAVQLSALALLNRVLRGHYLAASALATELAVLHNFVWHLHYTWRERRSGSAWPAQLLRFQLSNGLVSLLGSLLLMRLLVQSLHLPVLLSNMVAIICCSAVNFALSHRWAFAAARTKALLAVALLAISGTAGRAQTPATKPQSEPYEGSLGTDCAYENIFVGPIASMGGNRAQASMVGGVTIGQYFARTFGRGVTASPQFELGVIGPLPGGYPLDGLAGFNLMFANKVPRHELYPSFTAGYTRMFATGNAANFGVGLDIGKRESDKLMRIELRDYFLFTGPQQHVVALRIGFGKFIAD
jgi:putative flippase GtrA